MTKHSKLIHAMVEGALMVALAEILGYIKFGHLPNGGSISLMMLPIVVYALRWGLGRGLLAGLVLGILDFMLGGGISIGWQSILGDYVVACTLIGLAGAGSGKGMPGVVLGTVLGCLGRFASIVVTGAVVWGIYMPDTFLGLTMTNEWVYSLLYNGITVAASGVLTVLVVVVLTCTPMKRYILAQDLAR